MSRLLSVTEPIKTTFRVCIQDRNTTCILKNYDKDAVLKGTFSKKPVQGKEAIEKYFKKLFRTVNDVRFGKNPILIKKSNLLIESGNYTFVKCTGEIIKANYQFIIKDSDKKIISHFSSLISK